MTPLQEGCAVLRELFQTLVGAGFSEGQACQIVAFHLAAMMSSARGEETS